MAAKEREIPWQAINPWMKQAYEFGVKTKGWYVVTPGSKEHAAWGRYFDGLGWRPWAFKELGKSVREWTAPCQWPEWLNVEAAA